MRIKLILALLVPCIGAYAQPPEPLQDDECADCSSPVDETLEPVGSEITAEFSDPDQLRVAKPQYERDIHDQILRNWDPPPTAASDLECVVTVTQVPSGEVVDVGFGRCDADEAVRGSIKAAVFRASPLPRPPIQSLFERNLVITFTMGK